MYKCLNCNFAIESYSILAKCPLCQGIMQVETPDIEEDDIIIKAIEEDEIEQMKWAIKQDGNDTIWKDIESIISPFARIKERKLFIKVGGKVPRNFEVKT